MEALKITPNSNKYRKFSTEMTVPCFAVLCSNSWTQDIWFANKLNKIHSKLILPHCLSSPTMTTSELKKVVFSNTTLKLILINIFSVSAPIKKG